MKNYFHTGITAESMTNLTYRSLFLLIISLPVFFSCSNENRVINKKTELISGWKFRQAGTEKWYDAKVPGCVHTDLINNKLIEDPFYRTNEKDLQWISEKDWEYSLEFDAGEKILNHQAVDLCFKGLDTYADVFLNGTKIMETSNMFREWRQDVKKNLREGKNTLTIVFHSPIQTALPLLEKTGYEYPANNDQAEKKVSVFTRKAPYHYGWDWGPRFVTSGIWRPVILETYDMARINTVQVVQNELTGQNATLTSVLEIKSLADQDVSVEIVNRRNDKVLYEGNINIKEGDNTIALPFNIENPELWYPVGLGKQALYPLTFKIISSGKIIDTISQKIGLRTIEVVNQKDSLGKSFYVKVNGRPVFMKGANYIPSDNFVNRVDKEKYDYYINATLAANMNMLRVWGGGIYEEDYFYEQCDEKGILIWQDFMFACSMYPGDEAFLSNIKEEAIYNVKRLRNHPSIVLWCGNNEQETAWFNWGWQKQFGWTKEVQDKMWSDYKTIFHRLLPAVVQKYDSSRFYTRSSPSANEDSIGANILGYGDNHYWGVWHAEEPFENYQKNISRFMSEYGLQSFPEIESVAKYALPSDYNIESVVMKHHQRHPRGNELIRTYLDMYYGKPKNFESMLYASQVQQADAMKYATEAHRRAMPYNMGTLYWQLNDCWPVASWSGIDYYGKWKALHYYAKNFFRTVLISPVLEKDKIDVYLVSDSTKNFPAVLEIKLMNFKGDKISENSVPVTVMENKSAVYHSFSLKEFSKKEKRQNVCIVFYLKDSSGNILSRNILYPEPFKKMKLVQPTFQIDSKANNDNTVTYTILTNVPAKNVRLSLKSGQEGTFSDNYFDLLPGENKTVRFTPASGKMSAASDLTAITFLDAF